MQTKAAQQSTALRRRLRRLWSTPPPSMGCEISHTAVSVARWSGGGGLLDAAAWKPIPDGAVEASPLRDNIQRTEEVQRACAGALSALGIAAPGGASKKLTEAVLVIPDQAARLFVLNFETFPSSRSEGLPLVQWRLKKSLPFDLETAAISYFVQRSGTELQVVAVATPQRIVRQYEAVAQQFGLRPRRVTLSTLACLSLAGEENPSTAAAAKGDGATGVLTVKYSPPWLTTAVVQSGTLRLFRTVALPAAADGLLSPADILGCVYPSIAYFQDNFQGTVARGYLSGFAENRDAIAAALEQELQLKTSPLVPDLDRFVSGMDPGVKPYGAERHFAALLGIAREHQNR